MPSPLQVGRYELRARIGRGGMAEVFEATHFGAADFERTVCIKRILSVHAMDQEFRELFMREAKVAGRLSHSNIVQVFDCVEDGEHIAIVMELVDGLDLRQLILQQKRNTERLDEGIVAYIAGQMLLALRFAHSQRVVHRDVSPHNILISRKGEVKLADFGVAKAMLSQATRTGDLKGKLAYMSPEQARGLKVDYRTDLYSLGLVLYELIEGKRFFQIESQAELFGAVAHAERPRLARVAPDLASFVERLLEPAQSDRYATADEALSQLPRWSHTGPAGALSLATVVEGLDVPSRVPLDASSGASHSASEPTYPASQMSASDNGERGPTINAGGTEVLAVRARRHQERPVIPGDRNAPTATREDDVEKAIAMAPTIEHAAEVDAPDTLLDGSSPDVDPGHTGNMGRGVVVTPSRLVVGGLIGAVLVAAAIVFGGQLVDWLMQSSDDDGLRAQPGRDSNDDRETEEPLSAIDGAGSTADERPVERAERAERAENQPRRDAGGAEASEPSESSSAAVQGGRGEQRATSPVERELEGEVTKAPTKQPELQRVRPAANVRGERAAELESTPPQVTITRQPVDRGVRDSRGPTKVRRSDRPNTREQGSHSPFDVNPFE